jgi:hypothetical protein
MKNAFKLSSLLFVGVLLFQFSCEDDPAAPAPVIPDPTGQWALTLATLIDGNAVTPETADSLIIENFTQDGQNFFRLALPVGDFQTTSLLVGGALAATTCQNPANYATFFIELVADGQALIFNCSGEQLSGQAGTWTLLQDDDGEYTVLNLSVLLEGISVPVAIRLENLVVTDTQISGRALGYPMKKDFLLPIAEPGNLQIMTTDIVFSAVQ